MDSSLTAQIKAYALEHYDEGGWDVIVECWDDEQIDTVLGHPSYEVRYAEDGYTIVWEGEIGPATNLEEAIEKFSTIVSVYAECQADAMSSVF